MTPPITTRATARTGLTIHHRSATASARTEVPVTGPAHRRGFNKRGSPRHFSSHSPWLGWTPCGFRCSVWSPSHAIFQRVGLPQPVPHACHRRGSAAVDSGVRRLAMTWSAGRYPAVDPHLQGQQHRPHALTRAGLHQDGPRRRRHRRPLPTPGCTRSTAFGTTRPREGCPRLTPFRAGHDEASELVCQGWGGWWVCRVVSTRWVSGVPRRW